MQDPIYAKVAAVKPKPIPISASNAITEPVNLKPIPQGKLISIQEPVRDLAQIYDNRPRNDDPRFLAADQETEKFNQAPGSVLFINGRESNSGAAPEVAVQVGWRTLESIERQGAALPRKTPTGKPFYLAFLARAGFGFCREPRSMAERKFQYRCVAEQTAKNGQVAKISIFDTPHRPSEARDDYRSVYELQKEGLPIVYETAIGVSDDVELTESDFRDRLRSFLEMDATIRKECGAGKSAMHSLALKNTDGRLRGDNVDFTHGNAREYARIQLEVMDEFLKKECTGPTEARLHTHNIGHANRSAAAYIDGYLSTKTENAISACVDMLPGSKYFPNLFSVLEKLREQYGWDIALSPEQKRIAKRKQALLEAGIAPFRDLASFAANREQLDRFRCAPAAMTSGIRMGTRSHVRGLWRSMDTQDEQAKAQIQNAVTLIWGLFNGACQRLLRGYSITPIANFDNQSAGDLTGWAIKTGFVQRLLKEGTDPFSIPDGEWDKMALEGFGFIKQVPAANYLTRDNINYLFLPEVFRHLCMIRTSAVLPEDQQKSFFAGMAIRNYAVLRSELLAAITDKDAASVIFDQHGVPEDRAQVFVAKYIGRNTVSPYASLPDLLALAGPLIDKLAGSNRELRKELQFDAIVGSRDGKIPERQLSIIANTPSTTHVNLYWWEGVDPPMNALEQRMWTIFKENNVETFEKLFHANRDVAMQAAKDYIKNSAYFRHDFGIAETLFYNVNLRTSLYSLRAEYSNETLDKYTVWEPRAYNQDTISSVPPPKWVTTRQRRINLAPTPTV